MRFLMLFLLTAFLSLHGATSDDSSPEVASFETFDATFDEEFGDEFDTPEPEADFDPLSGYNRAMTTFNDFVYINALIPVARGYAAVVPKPGRTAVSNVFQNLRAPIRIVNNLLQLKLTNTVEETGRFVINSTLGILGIWDPASEWFGLKTRDEDFGQTLGHYGVGPGFHIVLPILGPSNLRDSVALAPDWYLDPLTYTTPETSLVDSSLQGIVIQGGYMVNETSLNYKVYESVRKDAVDLYPFMRNLYEQSREKAIEE